MIKQWVFLLASGNRLKAKGALKSVVWSDYGENLALYYLGNACYYIGYGSGADLVNFIVCTNISSIMKQNDFLKQVYVALTNAASSPELLSLLKEYGYNDKKLREGLKLYNDVEQLNQQQQLANQEAKTTVQSLQATRQQLIDTFQTHLDTARLAYKREADYTDTLSLTQARQKTVPDLLAQTQQFYANIPVALMEKYHVSQQELTDSASLVQQVKDLVALQRKAQAQVQTLTQTRQAAMAELKDWMKIFFTIAKVALREHPQQLEALDIVVPS
ncbi:hypothetical protein [Tunicatimonas pelagia]|uniref:hypothetical protein n=1 Tax=Tunicatimonas pelagia TaxID=931531 RepID=UPI0026671FC9|nr:hypothetical protein [Tunicatimonas pelagia]WKN43911.1 hypothetical protein P0M28_02860 [Tunicatimonas pelagia]